MIFDYLIERVDTVYPDYDIQINVSLELPLSSTLNISLNDLPVTTTTEISDELTVMLNTSVLSYLSNTSTHLLQFQGLIGENVSDGQNLTLSGLVEYVSYPSNGRSYVEIFTFPVIYLIEPKLSGSLIFDSLVENESGTEIITWELTLRDIAGPPYDLTVNIYVDQEILELLYVEVQTIG